MVWELGQSAPPFTLAVENLRPDLVRVDMPPMPNTMSRSKRSSIAYDSRWFSYHHDETPVEQNSGLNKSSSPVRPEWLGPTVFLLREDESFIGKFSIRLRGCWPPQLAMALLVLKSACRHLLFLVEPINNEIILSQVLILSMMDIRQFEEPSDVNNVGSFWFSVQR